MLNSRMEPRINEEVQIIIHYYDLAKIGDRYLYQNNTEIRVYGCELPPYKLPKYLPDRIFALEYIRQMINSDVSFKKKQQLRIKSQIGSFIWNNRVAGEEANNLLKHMDFILSFPWNYYPFGIISEIMLKHKTYPYAHVPKTDIGNFMNQTYW